MIPDKKYSIQVNQLLALNDFTGADKVYIACGYTDLRRGINGLVGMVQQQFQLDPFTNCYETIRYPW